MPMLGGIGDAFADRNFRVYSLGAIVSWLSFFVQRVAVSWTTWELISPEDLRATGRFARNLAPSSPS